jgi:type IV pilus assembly protein PilA
MSGGIQARNGFTLVELMIVIAIISIIVVIAIPSIAGAKLASNEASAISSLRTLTTANQHYRTRFQRYPTALTDLSATGYIDTVLGTGSKSGYVFAFSGSTDTWSIAADPSVPGTTGFRGFFVDESGVIRFSEPGPATSSSNPID